MKKLIAALFAAFLLVGCGGIAPSNEETDLRAELEKYRGACAKNAFKETNLKLDEVEKLRDQEKINEANKALTQANELFDAALINFNDSQSSIDRAEAEITDQNSRLTNLEANGMKYAPAEYKEASKNIRTLHKEAAAKIDQCDVFGAVGAVNEADRELRYLEDLINSRMGGKAAVPVKQNVKKSDVKSYVVVKGDSLWKIANKQFSNPYFWPLIYWANKDMIKDPDLIYPKQTFKIDANVDSKKKSDAEKFAKTRGAWSLYDNK